MQNLPVPLDRRVWQEALALTGAGRQVHVICPRTAEHPRARETLEGVRIYRYRPGPQARRLPGYALEYLIAVAAQLALALRVGLRQRVEVVHLCNPPDLLFLVALPLALLGSRVVYDHHDACPELMMAKGCRPGSGPVRLTRVFERITYRVCDVSIETNESFRSIALERGGMAPEDVFVVRSAPQAGRFAGARPDASWRRGRAHMVGYVGIMGRQDGVDHLLEAAALIVGDWGRDVQFVLAGDGPEAERLHRRAAELGVAGHVTFTGMLSDSERLGSMLATADVCVSPDEANPMNDISTMNKVLEYMSLGKPVVQFDLREGRVSAGEASLYAARNDVTELAKAIASLLDEPETRARMGRAGLERMRADLSWEAQIPSLLAAYARARAKRRRG